MGLTKNKTTEELTEDLLRMERAQNGIYDAFDAWADFPNPEDIGQSIEGQVTDLLDIVMDWYHYRAGHSKIRADMATRLPQEIPNAIRSAALAIHKAARGSLADAAEAIGAALQEADGETENVLRLTEEDFQNLADKVARVRKLCDHIDTQRAYLEGTWRVARTRSGYDDSPKGVPEPGGRRG